MSIARQIVQFKARVKSPYYKFSWRPRIVRTWRPSQTVALIWLQFYLSNENGEWVDYLGFFSAEG